MKQSISLPRLRPLHQFTTGPDAMLVPVAATACGIRKSPTKPSQEMFPNFPKLPAAAEAGLAWARVAAIMSSQR